MRADVTERNKHLLSYFLTLPMNTNQLNSLSLSASNVFKRLVLSAMLGKKSGQNGYFWKVGAVAPCAPKINLFLL